MRRPRTNFVAPGRSGARLLSFLSLAAFLVGCQIHLVPPPDPAIVNGLTAANEKTLQLFAALAEPGARAPYAEREATYNELIGTFDSLRIQAEARPVPDSRIAEMLVSGSEGDLKLEDIKRLQNPTPDILRTIIDTLTRMREVDSEGRLSAGMLPGFKTSYETSIDQALTFEQALLQQ